MSHMSKLIGHVNIVSILPAVDVTGGIADTAGEYILMRDYRKVCFVASVGQLAADVTILFREALVDGGATQLIAGRTIALVNGTDDDTVAYCEIDVKDDLDVDNNYDWITYSIAAPQAACLISLVALCYEARFEEVSMPANV